MVVSECIVTVAIKFCVINFYVLFRGRGVLTPNHPASYGHGVAAAIV